MLTPLLFLIVDTVANEYDAYLCMQKWKVYICLRSLQLEGSYHKGTHVSCLGIASSTEYETLTCFCVLEIVLGISP